MDPTVLAGMLFVLTVLAMLLGFVLLWPVSRRLGAVLEQRLEDKNVEKAVALDANQVMMTLQAIQAEIEQLSERQEFTESLLAERQTLLLPQDKQSS